MLFCDQTTPSELSTMMCGNAAVSWNSDLNFDFRDVFKVALDAEMIEEGAASVELANALWDVLNSVDASAQRRILKFITGVSTLPASKSEVSQICLV